MSESNKAVFLSYASQDAEAARRICEALRSGGVEVWFDADGGLEHGDEWDAKIRRQIKECVLFIPIISASTQARHEGYFRIEWELAAQRAMGIASGVPFILPVVIDDTREPDALVPDRFRMVQWTKLPGGVVTPEVKARYLKLWSHRTGALKATELERGPVRRQEAGEGPASTGRTRSRRRLFATVGVVAVVAAIAAAVVFWPRVKPDRAAPGAPAVSREAAPTAAQLVQKARELLQTPSRARAELELADGFCRQASVLDELSAELWAVWSLVDAWSVYYNFDNSAQRREAARTKAEKAMQLAPTGFEPRLAQASFLVLANQHAGALSAFAQKADQLLRELRRERPRDPDALLAFALLQRNMDRTDEARATLRELATIPRYAAMAYTELGWAEDGVGNLAAASEAASRAVAEERYWNSLILKADMALNWEGDVVQAKAMLGQMPTSALQEDYGIYEALLLAWVQRDAPAMLGLVASVPREWLQSNFFEGPTQYFAGAAHQLANRAEAARQSWSRALQTVEKRLAVTPDQPESLIWKVRLQAGLGELAAAQATFRLFKQVATRPVMRGERPFERAADLWLLGERDAALAHLEDCLRRNEVTWAQFQTTPTFEPMRSNPRFQALVEQARQNPRLAPPHAREEKAPAKSIAVLAFENRSGDETLAAGITDDLSMVLGRVPGLRVAARTSSLYFKGKAMPVREIARELDVAYVVEGSVQKDGTRVKVNVTLIKAQDGFRVWSDQFVQELKEVLALQERIAAVIAQNLSLQLGAAGRSRERVDPRAFELYAEARFAWGTRTLEGFSLAERALLQAVEIAPRYAQAHAALVDVWGLRGQWSDRPSAWGLRNVPELARLIAKGEQALSYDPQSAEAKTALGGVYWSAWRFTEGEHALREAIQLNPNHATAHQWLGRTLLTLGRMDEALASLATAARFDPLAPRILDNYAWALILAGRINQGLSVLERALALQPAADQARGLKAVALAMRGEREAAAVVARSVSNETSITAWLRVQGLALAGETVEAGTLLEGYREGNLTAKLCGLAALGRHEAVLQTLDVDWLVSTRVDWLLFHPIFDPVRSDPRFQAAMATVGLTEAHARAQAWRAANPPEQPEGKR